MWDCLIPSVAWAHSNTWIRTSFLKRKSIGLNMYQIALGYILKMPYPKAPPRFIMYEFRLQMRPSQFLFLGLYIISRNEVCSLNNLSYPVIHLDGLLYICLSCWILSYVRFDEHIPLLPFFELVVAACLHFSVLRVKSWTKNKIHF